MSNANTSYVQFASAAVVGNETATIRTIAAVVASVFRIGGYAERGYAASFTAELAQGIAIARNGDAYTKAGMAQQKVMFDKAYPTAKRYAEKSVGICKLAERKAAPMLDIMGAESSEQAADIVAGWFFGASIAAATCDELYEAFGFSTGKKKAEKATDAGDESTNADGKGPAGVGDDTNASPVTPAESGVALDNALAFAETIKSVLKGSTPEARKALALAIIADIQAAIDWTGDTVETPAVETPAVDAPVPETPVETKAMRAKGKKEPVAA